ncbi:unnamed protein product [Prunus armeniaca]|uniref:Expansin-like CBD domain-containing protein n=1 Tax=Prunus armeniaca TaxID=36596 RepID=A0A6J5X7J5_PRUAR|nr:unnamed protein product [Prunus armeniaca]
MGDGQASTVARLYRNGTGCDYGEGDTADFIFRGRAYAKLASNPAAAERLFAYDGVVEIEYRRIPCQFSGANLVFKVHEHSKYPEYLAIVIQYVAGQNDITAVELWQEDCKQWRAMRRYGAVWDTPYPPSGSINCRGEIGAGKQSHPWRLESWGFL